MYKVKTGRKITGLIFRIFLPPTPFIVEVLVRKGKTFPQLHFEESVEHNNVAENVHETNGKTVLPIDANSMHKSE